MKKFLIRIFSIGFLVCLPITLILVAFYKGILEIFNTFRTYNTKRDVQVLVDAIKTGDINSFSNKEREARLNHIRKNWRK